MSHEQSETAQNPLSGLWVNRYGRKTEKAGQTLPRQAGSGKDAYESLREAETAATYRSYQEGVRHGGYTSHMPKGGQQSPEGDLGELRQREALKVFPVLKKMTDHVKRPARRLPVKKTPY